MIDCVYGIWYNIMFPNIIFPGIIQLLMLKLLIPNLMDLRHFSTQKKKQVLDLLAIDTYRLY